jgi:hypothetical protein
VMLRRCKLVLLLYDAKRAVAAIAVARVVLVVLAVGVLIQTHQMQTGGAVLMASLVVTMRCVLSIHCIVIIAVYLHCSTNVSFAM